MRSQVPRRRRHPGDAGGNGREVDAARRRSSCPCRASIALSARRAKAAPVRMVEGRRWLHLRPLRVCRQLTRFARRVTNRPAQLPARSWSGSPRPRTSSRSSGFCFTSRNRSKSRATYVSGNTAAASSWICLPRVAPRDVVQHEVLHPRLPREPGRLLGGKVPEVGSPFRAPPPGTSPRWPAGRRPPRALTRLSTRPASPTNASLIPGTSSPNTSSGCDDAAVGQRHRLAVDQVAPDRAERHAKRAAFSGRKGRRAFSSNR